MALGRPDARLTTRKRKVHRAKNVPVEGLIRMLYTCAIMCLLNAFRAHHLRSMMREHAERYVRAVIHRGMRESLDDGQIRRLIALMLPKNSDLPAEEVVWPELRLDELTVTDAVAGDNGEAITDLASAVEQIRMNDCDD